MTLDLSPDRKGYKGLTAKERFWAKVQKTSHCWEWNGTKSDRGYGRFLMYPKSIPAHRLAYLWEVGDIGAGLMIDHMCHNTSCVRPDHLRLVTNKQNQENQVGIQSRNRSGYRGVNWDSQRRKWRSTVTHQGRRVPAGHFDTPEEANAAAVRKRNELYTHNDRDRGVHV